MSMILAVLYFMLSIGKPALTMHEECNSTQFGMSGDQLAGGDALCLHRPINSTDIGIAHRWLPCGAKVQLTNLSNGQTVEAVVVDHGPYGALDSDGNWFIKRDPAAPGTYRGCADLTPAAGRAIGHTGWNRIILTYASHQLPDALRTLDLSTLAVLDQIHRSLLLVLSKPKA